MKLVLSTQECDMLIEALRTHINYLDGLADKYYSQKNRNWEAYAERENDFDELREKLYTARGDEE